MNNSRIGDYFSNSKAGLSYLLNLVIYIFVSTAMHSPKSLKALSDLYTFVHDGYVFLGCILDCQI